jgi:invasion protein IalB
MLIQLPLGVYLPAGVTLTLGSSKAKVLVFETCNPNGCVAEHPITPAEINTLANGDDIKLAVRTADRSAFEFDVPSKGFAAAYAKIIDN